MKKILIAGGTGLIGKALIEHLRIRNYELSILTRKGGADEGNVRYFKWDVEKEFIASGALEDINVFINLTGANIGAGRWTKSRKEELYNSRINSLKLIHKYLRQLNVPVEQIISSSAVGYYGAETSRHIYKETDVAADDFLGKLGNAWEAAAQVFWDLPAAVVILRKGGVIAKDGGLYKKIAPLAKLGIRPALGSGEQYMPWIDIMDLCRIYDYFLTHPECEGTFNAVASEHATMNDIANALLASFHKKSMLPNVPAFLIKSVFGELSAMLLKGSRVSNEKLKATGFSFEYDSLSNSFIRILHENARS